MKKKLIKKKKLLNKKKIEKLSKLDSSVALGALCVMLGFMLRDMR